MFLRPPHLQLQRSTIQVPVPVFGQPEAIQGDDSAAWGNHSPPWAQLRFWNCSALQADLSVKTSSPEILSAELASPGKVADFAAGFCNLIFVTPLTPGNVTVTAMATRVQGRDVRLDASVKLQVYLPLGLRSGEMTSDG